MLTNQQTILTATFDKEDLNPLTLDFLAGITPSWQDTDTDLNQHIFSIYLLIDDIEDNVWQELNPIIKFELEAIRDICDKNLISYFQLR